METPTRFLLESGQFNLTPGFGSFGEVNPFDVSFTTSELPSLKAESDNHWQKHDHRSLLTPSDDKDSLFRSALRSNSMQDSRHGSMAQLPDMSRPFDMSPNTITALTSAPFTSATMTTAPAASMYGDNIALFPSLEPASLSLRDSPSSGSASKKRKNQPATNASTKKRTKRTKAKSDISSLASPPESNNDESTEDTPESQSWETTQQVTPPGDNSLEEPKALRRTSSSSKRPSARKSNSRRSSTVSKASSLPEESDEEGLDDEEKRKRFLERNRVAASKCRQKKKAWVNHLESQSEEISVKNKHLSLLVSTLKEEVLMLKNQLLAHSSCDCKVVRDYLHNQSNQTAALIKSQQAQHQSQPLAQNLYT